MKEKDLIMLKLWNLEEKVVSRKTICDVIHDKQLLWLKRLRETGHIQTIFQNYYYVLSEDERKTKILKYFPNEMVFMVLNKLNIKWYIAFEKALELQGILWQSYRKVSIINSKISGKYIIMGTEFVFTKAKRNHIFGFKQNKTKNRIIQNIASPEKIFIDLCYYKKQIPLELKEKIDSKKVLHLLNTYPENFQKKIRRLLL